MENWSRTENHCRFLLRFFGELIYNQLGVSACRMFLPFPCDVLIRSGSEARTGRHHQEFDWTQDGASVAGAAIADQSSVMEAVDNAPV